MGPWIIPALFDSRNVIFSCDGELTGTQDRGPGLVYVPGKV